MSLKSKNSGNPQDPSPDLKDNPLAARLLEGACDNELACARAFEIGKETGASPEEIGRTLDLCGVRISKCQLGLFGYVPHKKTVKPKSSQDVRIEAAIGSGLTDERFPCRTAWDIASQFNVPKMSVSNACEAMGIKIKPCQLGAF
ncbi:MAG: hypothetical protein H8D61_00840 [Deltaproteobacteria bacterium]|nr:hypothetical protein [Deltaproteobacteria bacterium]